MSTAINWSVDPDDPVLQSNHYLKYSVVPILNIAASDVKGDIKVALASNESAAVVSYLAWVLRIVNLVAD